MSGVGSRQNFNSTFTNNINTSDKKIALNDNNNLVSNGDKNKIASFFKRISMDMLRDL